MLRLQLSKGERRKRSSKSASGTKTMSIKKWLLLKKFVDRKSKSSIICMECVKISTIRLSSVSSKSGKLSHKAWPNKMISLRISVLKPDKTSIYMLMRWQAKLMISRKRALNWKGLRMNSFANFKRLKSRNVRRSNVLKTPWLTEAYRQRCAPNNQFRCRNRKWVEDMQVSRLLKPQMKKANLIRMQMVSEYTKCYTILFSAQ